jgi:hypothetical protein
MKPLAALSLFGAVEIMKNEAFTTAGSSTDNNIPRSPFFACRRLFEEEPRKYGIRKL